MNPSRRDVPLPPEDAPARIDLGVRGPISVEQYHRMVEQGVFREDDRLELIRGLLVAKSPQSGLHGRLIQRLNRWLVRGAGEPFDVRVQLPLTVGDLSEPAPDVAVVLSDEEAERLSLDHPTSAALVIEISLGSLKWDREVKGPLYAQASIPEYWIVNPRGEAIEVLRDPDPGSRRYRAQPTLRGEDVLAPVSLAGPRFKVSELFRGLGRDR